MNEQSVALNCPANPDADPAANPGRGHGLLHAIVFALAYFLSAFAGKHLSFQPLHFVIFWFPSGVFASVLLCSPRRQWPALILAAALANLGFDLANGQHLPTSLGFVAANCLEAATGAWLVGRLAPDRPCNHIGIRELLAIIGASSILSPALGAAVGATVVYHAFGVADWAGTWLTWWSSDGLSVVVLTPFLISVCRYGRGYLTRLSWPRTLEFCAALVVLGCQTFWVFGQVERPDFKFILIPVLVWVALRFRLLAVGFAGLVLASLAVLFSVHVAHRQDSDPAEVIQHLQALQLFLMTALTSVMLLAATLNARRRAEEAIQASQEQFRIIADHTYDWESWLDNDGRLLWVNPAVERITGRSPAECLAMSDYPLPLALAEDREILRQAIGQGLSGQAGNNVPFRILGPAGETRWVAISWNPVSAADGAPYGLRTSIRDIDERKRAIEALRESEERYRRIVENSMDGVFLVDLAGQIRDVNGVTLRMLGYGRDELLGKAVASIDPNLAGRDFTTLWEAVPYETPTTFETVLLRKDGFRLNVEVRACRFQESGTDYLLGVVRDITDRKRAEDALRQEDARLRKLAEIVQYEAADTLALLDFALDKCLELTGSKYGYIYHYDEATQAFTLNSWSKEVMKACTIAKPKTCYELSTTGIWGEAVRQRRPIILNDFAAQHPLKKGYPEGHARLTRFLTVPIMTGNRIVAVVGVANKAAEYGDTDVLQLTLLMDAAWRVVEQRRAEEARRTVEQRLTLALDATNDGLWDWRMDAGKAYFSPRYYTMLGYAPDEFPPTFENFSKLVHPEDLPRIVDTVERLLLSQDAAAIEMRMRAKSGDWVWILTRCRVTLRADDGRPLRLTGTHSDITERKRFEAALRESEERFRSLFTSQLDAVALHEMILDEKGQPADYRFLALNPAFEKLLGLPAESILGRTVLELLPGTEPYWVENYGRVAMTGEPIHFENYHAGLGRHFEVNAYSPQPGQFAVVARDVTERFLAGQELARAKDAAEAASRTKSEFLATMSHEIRTPLNGVLGMLQLAQTTDLTPEQAEYLETALQSGRSLLRVLSDVLDISRVEAGAMSLLAEDFRPAEVFEPIADAFAEQSQAKALGFACSLDPDLPESLFGDAGRIRQVVYNLVGNAMKYTLAGEVRLEAFALPVAGSSGNVRLCLSVSDTGIGVPADKVHDIFEAFTQLDGSYTRRYGGIGLGLTIVKRLVELMGGTIEFCSLPGVGTDVLVMLPLRLGRAEAPARSRPPAVPEPSSESRRLDVLLAEDDVVNRLTVSHMLSKAGHRVHEVENGAKAVAFLAENLTDCVLMDIQMPGMDGVEATRRIRAGEAGEAARAVPVIALTAHAMKGDREEFLAAGMDGYLAKPVDMGELARILGEVVHGKLNS